MTNPKTYDWYAGASADIESKLDVVDALVDTTVQKVREILAGLMIPGAGSIFYVNGGSDGPANDTGDGLTPLTPKRTLQAAIDLCTANKNDYVVVMNYGGNARAVEAWPVEVNKDLIHIIGVGTAAQKWPVVSVLAPAGADTANPALLVTANRVEIANLELGGGDTAGCVHVGSVGGVWGVEIHDCFFGVTGDGVGQDGIRVPVTHDAGYLTVWGCRFGAFVTRDGIRVDGNATRAMLGLPGKPANIFNQVPGIAIDMAGTVVFPSIMNNIISVPANTAGAAITLSANVSDAAVFLNHANYGETDMGNNPYTEGAGAGVNTWGLNYKGVTAQLPA